MYFLYEQNSIGAMICITCANYLKLILFFVYRVQGSKKKEKFQNERQNIFYSIYGFPNLPH